MSEMKMKGRRGQSEATEEEERILFGEPAPRMHELAGRERQEKQTAASGGPAASEAEGPKSKRSMEPRQEAAWSDDLLLGEPAPRMHELAERERQAKAARAEGGPLPEALRRKFEQSLGQDLGDVEVQVGPEAAREAEALHAHAVTQGKTIRFAEGTYDPASAEGERLLAHEVIHTVQQEHAGVAKA